MVDRQPDGAESDGHAAAPTLSTGRRSSLLTCPLPVRDALLVIGVALGLRLVFSLLMANTFDEDEFVYLALGHDVAHGSMPYRDFSFFHPPGLLVLLARLDPLTSLWWPIARLADVLIDTLTTLMVWRIGNEIYGRRTALAAAFLYAANPVVLVSAVRVDQEVVMTALGMAGLTLLITRRSHAVAGLAGICLGAAFWIKYPMLVFLPVYLLAARRRAAAILVGFFGATAALFLPYMGEARRLFSETVTWQTLHRNHTPFSTRVATTVVFWLAINPFAIAALRAMRRPSWLVLGFATGCVFLFTSTAYSHYFVPVAPFAALLGAPLAAQIVRVPLRAAVAGSLAVACSWAVSINLASGWFVTIPRFSDIQPVVRNLQRSTGPHTSVLANRFELAYLAHRPWVAHYFWDDQGTVSAQYLARRLPGDGVTALYPYTNAAAYPPGFEHYLDEHYPRRRIGGIMLWQEGQGRRVSERTATHGLREPLMTQPM